MSFRPVLLLSAAGVLCGAVAPAARAADLRIYPVAGLYGLERTDCDASTPVGPVQTAKVAPGFCGQLTLERRQAIGQLFRSRVTQALPGVVNSLSAQVGAGETPEASLSKTVIASLQLSRADLWVVEKPVTADVYVPITVTLFLTNALTGGVMFVENYSTITQGTLSKDHYLQEAQAAFGANLDQAVEAVVRNAAARFKPYPVSGKIRTRVGDAYVFDVGRHGGIREGDTIGPDAQVVFSEANYSIVRPLLGSLNVGQTLSRQVAQPVQVLEKPAALVVVAKTPPGISRAYLNAVFEDAVGQSGGLAIAPVNPSFAQLRTLALAEAGVSGNYQNARIAPDYFIRLSVSVLDPLDLGTNLAHARRQVYEAHAFIEVIDHSGRVVFATHASNRIVDEVLHGVSFSPDQRRDTVVKNALVEAAAALAKGFRPAKLRLPARSAGDAVAIDDPGGALSLGSKAVLLRRVGGVSGIVGDVWRPVGHVEVDSVDDKTVRAHSTDVTPERARDGDQVAYDSAGTLVQSRRQFAPCEASDGSVVVGQRGAVRQPLFGDIATNAFAAAFAAPVRLSHFEAELQPYVRQFADAGDLAVLHPKAAEICFEPVYQVDPAGETTADAGFIRPSYTVAMGIVLRRAGQKVTSGALQQTLTATSVPASASPTVREAALQYDLAAEAATLTAQVARSITPPR